MLKIWAEVQYEGALRVTLEAEAVNRKSLKSPNCLEEEIGESRGRGERVSWEMRRLVVTQ